MVIGPLLVLTDRSQVRDESLTDRIARIVDGGAPTIVVREKDLDAEQRRDIVERTLALGVQVIVASDARLAASTGALGVHLGAHDERIASSGQVVGRSCHTVTDVDHAHDEGLDYVTLSPVFMSRSKPGYEPAVTMADLAAAGARLPTFALGGVDGPEQVQIVRHAGVSGVAVMGALMRCAEPTVLTRALLEELQ